MNLGGKQAENNWWNLAKRKDLITAYGHKPSMTADTAVDFYSLAVSVTRRLVQSSLFFAMSRLRSSNRSGNDRKGYIRTRDVRAAIEVLNMKHCRPNLLDTARRNETVLEDINNRKGWVPTVFTYEEAEEIIDRHEWTRYRKDGTMYNGEIDDEDSEDDDDMEMDDDIDTDDNFKMEVDKPEAKPEPIPEPEESEREAEPESELDDIDHDPSRVDPSRTQEPEELEMDPEEEQADIADMNASRREEANFLKLMDQPVPIVIDEEPIKEEQNEDGTKALPERRMREDIYNWRDRMIYRNEWEEYGYDFIELKENIELPPLKRVRYNEPEVALPKPLPLSEPEIVNSEDEDEENED
jgi:hypothetical protein